MSLCEGKCLCLIFRIRIAEIDTVCDAECQTEFRLLNGITAAEDLDDQIDHI